MREGSARSATVGLVLLSIRTRKCGGAVLIFRYSRHRDQGLWWKSRTVGHTVGLQTHDALEMMLSAEEIRNPEEL